MKTCIKCRLEKELTEFSKAKRNKDGFRNQCKSCISESAKIYREENKDYYKEYSKKWHQENKEHKKEYHKEYRLNNKEYHKEYNKEYYKNNKEHIKEYYKNNKEHKKEYHKEYSKNNKERNRARAKKRRLTEPLFNIKACLRTRTSIAFRNKGYKKNSKTQEMLGVDWEVCKAHIERQFTKGMNWDNRSEWHIDHIIPLASANTEKELIKLCHYSNLQPLWAFDNLSKSDNIIGQQNKLRL